MGLLNLNTTPSGQLTALQYMDGAEQILFGLTPFEGLLTLIHSFIHSIGSLVDRV